jgi:hypothetical protein
VSPPPPPFITIVPGIKTVFVRWGGRRVFIVVETVLVARGSHGGDCHHQSSGDFLLGK